MRPVDLPIDKYSTGMWPYEDMWGEDGRYRSNDERRAVAQEFFNEVRKGESLAFFYVDERNPMFVDTGDRSSSRGPNVKHQVRPQRQASGGTTQFRGVPGVEPFYIVSSRADTARTRRRYIRRALTFVP